MYEQSHIEGYTYSWQDILPEFAPLPRPMVQMLFDPVWQANHLLPSITGSTVPVPYEKIWTMVQTAKSHLWFILEPHTLAQQEHGGLSSNWLQKHFSSFDVRKETPARQTVTDWQDRWIVRRKKYAILDENSVAALLLLRSLTRTQRNWLPKVLREEEPLFWVWGINVNEAVPRAYPYPLPPGLPNHTLLWSTWPGVTWCDGWESRGGQKGGMAWAGQIKIRGQYYWNLSKDEILAWKTPLNEVLESTFQQIAGLNQLVLGQYPALGRYSDPYQDQIDLHDFSNILLKYVGSFILNRTLIHYHDKKQLHSLPPQNLLTLPSRE